MSLRQDENKRRSYAPPVIKLLCVLIFAFAAKAGNEVVKARFENRYSQLSTVLFCIAAALCAYLAYRAVMEIGYVWDSRHPKAEEEASSREYTPDELCSIIGSIERGRVAFDIVSDGKTIIAGMALESGDGGEYVEKYYIGEQKIAGIEAFHGALSSLAGGKEKLTVAQIRSDPPIDGTAIDTTVKENR